MRKLRGDYHGQGQGQAQFSGQSIFFFLHPIISLLDKDILLVPTHVTNFIGHGVAAGFAPWQVLSHRVRPHIDSTTR